MSRNAAISTCLTIALAALAPAPAFAGTAGLSGSSLVVNATPGQVNNISITQAGPSVRVEETGSGATLTPGANCGAGGTNIVTCPLSSVASLTVNAGDRNDQVVNGTAFPSALFGEGDDDRLSGGSAADTLTGGAGWDVLFGGTGGDTFTGGSEPDYVSYQGRANSVTADTDGVADDGEPGENDNVGPDVESLIGGNGADVLTGNELDNGLDGGPGADTLNGGAGNDYLLYWTRNAAVSVSFDGVANDGEAGENDIVGADVESAIGGNGSDTITGDARANTLLGDDGADTVIGGGGADSLFGSSGIDFLDGGTGDDLLDGGTQADVMFGREGSDRANYAGRTAALTVTLDDTEGDGEPLEGDQVHSDVENVTGGSGADFLSGSTAANVLDGGAGGDTITAGAGADTLLGGPGIDNLDGADDGDTLDGGSEADLMNGGGGIDRATYAGRTAAVSADLDGDSDDGEAGELDKIGADVEQLTGGSGNDSLIGNPGANAIEGGSGDDFLSGGAGSDELLGGDGADVLGGGAEGDTLDGGAHSDTLNADDGPDTLSGADADDTLNGGEGTDTLRGGGGADRLNAGTGNDALEGGSENDVLIGEAGDDRLDGGSEADTLDGGPDADRLDGGAGPDTFNGGDGNDELSYASRTAGVRVDLDGVADDGENGENDNARGDIETLLGGSGADTMTGDGHANRVVSGAGDDTVDGAGGEDIIDTGAGADTLKLRDAAVDRATCGTEKDAVVSDPPDAVGADCETDDTGTLKINAADLAKPKVSGAPVEMGADGVARIKVSCPVGRSSRCRGTLTLELLKATKNRATGSRRSRRRAPAGRAKFSIASGKTAPVKVKLSRNGRRRVLRERKVRCSVNVALDIGGGKKAVTKKSITIRAARRSRRR